MTTKQEIPMIIEFDFFYLDLIYFRKFEKLVLDRKFKILNRKMIGRVYYIYELNKTSI